MFAIALHHSCCVGAASVNVMATLKLSIQLAIPSMDDANNFGVEIQEETLAEIQKVEDQAYQINDKIAIYVTTRAKLASKVT